jgi:hypothetical protein
MSEQTEIEISREAVYAVLLIIALVIFVAIGNAVSPRDADNRPVLLLPDVRAVEQYRAATETWVGEWAALDKQLRSILDAPLGNDLLGQSRKSQQAFDQALELSRAVESTESPSSLIGLSAQTRNAAVTYLNAAMAVARFISAPTPENKIDASANVAAAGRALRDLQANEWMIKRVTAAGAPAPTRSLTPTPVPPKDRNLDR